ncbi:hypothetical protein [Kineococcus aurantiacus]|uniref:hypothetical protein n=1 Tax=Kineococcus aurantiacus TaxID=37633 RepID=UPI0031D3F384
MQPLPGDTRRLQVLAALALPPESATPALLVELLLEALHQAVLPHLEATVTAWHHSSTRTGDDLEGRGVRRSGPPRTDLTAAIAALQRSVVGEPLLGRHGDPRHNLLEGIVLTGQRPDRELHPETFWNDEVVAYPDLREATLALSVPQDLLREHDASSVASGLAAWIQHAAREHGALTGYVTLDEHVTAWNHQSAWEIAVGSSPYDRDLTRTLYGYGWGTLLRPEHLAAFGGVRWLRSLLTVLPPGGTITEDPDGSVWLQLSPDIRTTTWQDIATLRGLLLPALPAGQHTIEQYFSPEPGTWVVTPYRI